MQLTNIQLNTVNEILSHYSAESKVKVDFKSPTGSGKTLMAGYFISALIEQNPSEKFIFVIAAPSSSSLPEFFEKKLNKYKADLPFSKFEVEYIQSPSSAKTDKTEANPVIIAEQNKVYIFGKSSFGKGRILSERGIIDDFVISAVDKGFKLIYIRDEAHIGDRVSNDDESRKFENLMQSNASFVLKMTATPDYMDASAVKIILKEKDLNDPNKNEGKFLLKTNAQILLKKDMADDKILKDAIDNFKKIQEEYKSLNLNLRPCLLLQVDNNSTTNREISRQFEENISKIKTTLENANLAWAQYFGNTDKDSSKVCKDKFTLDEITENNSDIDAVIFKIGPSTGWDIPRACMLVQLRNVYSASHNTQTIGRIKRNPYPNLEKNEITDKYYIYSNAGKLDKDIHVYNYNVKEEFKDETLARIEIVNKKDLTKAEATDCLKKAAIDFLKDKKNEILQQINGAFIITQNNELIYKKVRSVVNGNQIYTAISNPFIFLKEYKRSIASNKFIYDKIKAAADKFYKDEIKDQKISDTNFTILSEYFYTVLFEKHKRALLDIINKYKQFKPTYKLSLASYDPKSYVEMFFGDSQNIGTIYSDKYLFNIKNSGDNKQPLDSKPEAMIFEKLQKFILEQENKDKSRVKIWAKNFTSSNISGEYLDDNNSVCRSYFDFVIKFNNEIFLYIEVKGQNDIDPEKTAMLKAAYENYFEEQNQVKQQSLFTQTIVICVVKVADNDEIGPIECFYDKSKITKDLNTTTFDEILKAL
jgi:type III restriction enzyme